MHAESKHPLRTAAESISPKIRRDREDGLYILYGQAPRHVYFDQRRRGEWTVLVPSAEGVAAMESFLNIPQPFGFDHFQGHTLDEEDMRLLCWGIKLTESGCPVTEASLFERAVRRRAAQLLRLHDEINGGALPLCMRIAQTILKERKETYK